jgi:two-component SAPR family response regulator
MEGVDVKAVKIDEISEVGEEVELASASDILDEIAEEVEVFDDSYFEEHAEDFAENEETWELIDDIDGLNDVLEESDKNDLAQELYPGLIYIKK